MKENVFQMTQDGILKTRKDDETWKVSILL